MFCARKAGIVKSIKGCRVDVGVGVDEAVIVFVWVNVLVCKVDKQAILPSKR